MSHYGSWVLALFSVTALWVGPSNRWGWAVGFVGQCLLLVYSVTTEQYGFVFSAVVVGTVYLRNFALSSSGLGSQSSGYNPKKTTAQIFAEVGARGG